MTTKTKGKGKTDLIHEKGYAEDAAMDFLRKKGYIVVDPKPNCVTGAKDSPISFVAYDEETDKMAFVRVIDYRGQKIMDVMPTKSRMAKARRESLKWSKSMRWKGGRRHDLIEVFGAAQGHKLVFNVQSDMKGVL